jgi:hypothetical protein
VRTKQQAKKAVKELAVKRGRGRPRKEPIAVDGRPLTAAGILKRQIKATQDGQRMYAALKEISKLKVSSSDLRNAKGIADEALSNVSRP